jgi:hypothetical protein
MSQCALNRQGRSWTCFELEELELMSKAFNQTSLGLTNPIDLPGLQVVADAKENAYKRLLWLALQERFAPYCKDNEACWLDSVDLANQLKLISPTAYDILHHFTLKPKGTKKRNGWLSTSEIDYVMNQFVATFPHFTYIGCFPSDYYRLHPGKFAKDVTSIDNQAAIIFNVDESHQNGSHWVTVFFDVDRSTGMWEIEYFDSTGDFPPPNLEEFLTHPYFADADIVVNNKKHQRGNSECGIYALFYVLQRLQGYTMEEINDERIPDGEMNRFRDVLFRPWTMNFEF